MQDNNFFKNAYFLSLFKPRLFIYIYICFSDLMVKIITYLKRFVKRKKKLTSFYISCYLYPSFLEKPKIGPNTKTKTYFYLHLHNQMSFHPSCLHLRWWLHEIKLIECLRWTSWSLWDLALGLLLNLVVDDKGSLKMKLNFIRT